MQAHYGIYSDPGLLALIDPTCRNLVLSAKFNQMSPSDSGRRSTINQAGRGRAGRPREGRSPRARAILCTVAGRDRKVDRDTTAGDPAMAEENRGLACQISVLCAGRASSEGWIIVSSSLPGLFTESKSAPPRAIPPGTAAATPPRRRPDPAKRRSRLARDHRHPVMQLRHQRIGLQVTIVQAVTSSPVSRSVQAFDQIGIGGDVLQAVNFLAISHYLGMTVRAGLSRRMIRSCGSQASAPPRAAETAVG